MTLTVATLCLFLRHRFTFLYHPISNNIIEGGTPFDASHWFTINSIKGIMILH